MHIQRILRSCWRKKDGTSCLCLQRNPCRMAESHNLPRCSRWTAVPLCSTNHTQLAAWELSHAATHTCTCMYSMQAHLRLKSDLHQEEPLLLLRFRLERSKKQPASLPQAYTAPPSCLVSLKITTQFAQHMIEHYRQEDASELFYEAKYQVSLQ